MVTAIVNHRISVASSVDELQAAIVKTLGPVAAKVGLEVEAWGQAVDLAQFEANSGCHGSGSMGMGMDVFGHKGHKGHKGGKGYKSGKLVIGVAWNST